LLLPVRGRLETILIVPLKVLAAAALGDGAATAGEADGEEAGLVAGLAAVDGLAAADADGEVTGLAGAVVAGAAGAAVG
jgi:hypothetical protein